MEATPHRMKLRSSKRFKRGHARFQPVKLLSSGLPSLRPSGSPEVARRASAAVKQAGMKGGAGSGARVAGTTEAHCWRSHLGCAARPHCPDRPCRLQSCLSGTRRVGAAPWPRLYMKEQRMLGSATKKNIIATAALEWHPPHASTKVKLWGRAKTQALEVQELFFFNLVSVRLGVWVGAGMRRLAVGKDWRAEGWGLCWRLLAPRSDLGADKHVWRGLPVRDHLAGQWQ